MNPPQGATDPSDGRPRGSADHALNSEKPWHRRCGRTAGQRDPFTIPEKPGAVANYLVGAGIATWTELTDARENAEMQCPEGAGPRIP